MSHPAIRRLRWCRPVLARWCSYIAANLAIVFSQLGEETPLIDANRLAPRQHELFKLENKIGFSSILSGRADKDEATAIFWFR